MLTLPDHLGRSALAAGAAVLLAQLAMTPSHAEAAAAEPPAVAAADADAERQLAEARRRLEAAARDVARLSAESGQREVQVLRMREGDGSEGQVVMFGPEGLVDDADGENGPRAAPRRAILGVSLERPDGKADGAGVGVEAVTPGGPAAKAGLQSGDRITAVNGRKVGTPAEVVAAMREVQPGDRVKVDLQRDGKARSVQVTTSTRAAERFVWQGDGPPPRMPPTPPMPPLPAMGAMPPMPPLPPMAPMPGGGPQRFLREVWDGPLGELELVELSPQLGRYFGATQGVLVVRAGGALKLQDGDVLRSIGGRAPQDGAHALRILRSYRPGESVALEVLRDRKPLKFDAALPAESGRGRPHVGGMAVPPPPLPHLPPAPPAPAERPRQ